MEQFFRVCLIWSCQLCRHDLSRLCDIVKCMITCARYDISSVANFSMFDPFASAGSAHEKFLKEVCLLRMHSNTFFSSVEQHIRIQYLCYSCIVHTSPGVYISHKPYSCRYCAVTLAVLESELRVFPILLPAYFLKNASLHNWGANLTLDSMGKKQNVALCIGCALPVLV